MNRLPLVGFLILLALPVLRAQDQLYFTLSDYDLKGKVHTCEVRTDYGKEIFTFDREGRLLRSETVFSDANKIITAYEFSEGELVEKRIESINAGEVDRSQSFRYTYRITFEEDIMKVTENILSYDKNFSEKHVFKYDSIGTLQAITQSHQAGLDEIRFERRKEGDTLISEEWLNRELQKIEKEFTVQKDGKLFKHIRVEQVFQGEPYEAREEIYNAEGKRMIVRELVYRPEVQEYDERERRSFTYSENGVLQAEKIARGAAISEKGYVFQYDNHLPPNWIRKIETPENSYVSRVITYYDQDSRENKG